MESESDFLCSYLHSPGQYRKHRCRLARSSCGPGHPLLPASLAMGTRYRSQSMMATRFCITNVWFVRARTRVLSACQQKCSVCKHTCTLCLLVKCVCSCVFVCRWSSGLAYACIPTYLHTMFTHSFIRPPAGSPGRTEHGRVRVRRPYWWNSIVRRVIIFGRRPRRLLPGHNRCVAIQFFSTKLISMYSSYTYVDYDRVFTV